MCMCIPTFRQRNKTVLLYSVQLLSLETFTSTSTQFCFSKKVRKNNVTTGVAGVRLVEAKLSECQDGICTSGQDKIVGENSLPGLSLVGNDAEANVWKSDPAVATTATDVWQIDPAVTGGATAAYFYSDLATAADIKFEMNNCRTREDRDIKIQLMCSRGYRAVWAAGSALVEGRQTRLTLDQGENIFSLRSSKSAACYWVSKRPDDPPWSLSHTVWWSSIGSYNKSCTSSVPKDSPKGTSNYQSCWWHIGLRNKSPRATH